MKTEFRVEKTTNYDLFKYMIGNRDVSKSRIKNIEKSVESVGQLSAPIIVNEKMEIVDGQARFSAFKKLGLPIYYMVIPGMDIEDCRVMNAHQSNWSMLQYVDSLATENTSYQYLSALCKEFKFLGLMVIYACAVHIINKKNVIGHNMSLIRNGEFVCTKEQYEKVRRSLDFMARFKFLFKLGGRKESWTIPLTFCFWDEEIDNERLFQNCSKYLADSTAPVNMEVAFKKVETAYNTRNRNKVYIYTKYLMFCDQERKARREKNNEQGRKISRVPENTYYCNSQRAVYGN